MRPLLVALLLLSGTGGGLSQPIEQADSETAVRTLLGQLARGGYEGQAEKLVNRLGDQASVALTKIVSGDKLGTQQIDEALMVVRMAFSAPWIVQNEADRQPRTTLFVLRELELSTSDLALKNRISDVRNYVLQQARNRPRPH